MLAFLALASPAVVAAGVCTQASPCLTLNNGVVRPSSISLCQRKIQPASASPVAVLRAPRK